MILKKVSVGFLTLFFLNASGWGMEGGTSSPSLSCDYGVYDPERDKGEPYLYEIRIPRTRQDEVGFPTFKTRFFLLGSQHNVPKDLLQKATHHVVDSSDILIEEVTRGTFGDPGDISLRELTLHGLILKGGEDWTQNLSPEALTYFDEKLRSRITQAWGIEAHQISPVVVNYVVSESKRGHSYGNGMDRVLAEMFEGQSKPVLALEDGKTRFDSDDSLFEFNKTHCFHTLSHNTQTLNKTILTFLDQQKEQELAPEEEKKVSQFSDYFSGDVNTARRSGEDRSVQKRNLSWIPVMEDYMKKFHDKTVLFVVGYGHFPGEYGLLKLLSKVGYTVQRVYKSGSSSPRLDSLCNYLVGYTYRNLLLEAAEEILLKEARLKKVMPGMQELYEKHCQKQYDDVCNALEIFSDPRSVETAEISSNQYFELYKVLEKLKDYERKPHHTLFQRDQGGEIYPSRLWDADLYYAISMLQTHARLAKERTNGHNLNMFSGYHNLED